MLPLPLNSAPDASEMILCCYVNATAHTQIARITNVLHWSFERAVFPGQRLIFEAPAEAKLEIHTGALISAILSETIDCQKLQLTPAFSPRSVVSASR